MASGDVADVSDAFLPLRIRSCRLDDGQWAISAYDLLRRLGACHESNLSSTLGRICSEYDIPLPSVQFGPRLDADGEVDSFK